MYSNINLQYIYVRFQDFLPHMAKEYGFEYELVQYKWPRWLHQQTEKQRIIWGYKILFLDVLFPLDVRKIIFVDADQVSSQESVTAEPLFFCFLSLSSLCQPGEVEESVSEVGTYQMDLVGNSDGWDMWQ